MHLRCYITALSSGAGPSGATLLPSAGEHAPLVLHHGYLFGSRTRGGAGVLLSGDDDIGDGGEVEGVYCAIGVHIEEIVVGRCTRDMLGA